MSLEFSDIQSFIILMQDKLLEFENKYETCPLFAYLPYEDFDNLIRLWKSDYYSYSYGIGTEGLFLRRGQYFHLWGLVFYRSQVSVFDFGCPQRPDHLVGDL
jgi:hypothetical protein